MDADEVWFVLLRELTPDASTYFLWLHPARLENGRVVQARQAKRERSDVAAHAVSQGFWWPQRLQTGASVTEADIAMAEARVLDHLQGWRSIVPTYRAILDFDLLSALRAVNAPTLLLEFLAANEAHLERQAALICDIMWAAMAGSIHDADGLTPELRPSTVADAIIPFLLASSKD